MRIWGFSQFVAPERNRAVSYHIILHLVAKPIFDLLQDLDGTDEK